MSSEGGSFMVKGNPNSRSNVFDDVSSKQSSFMVRGGGNNRFEVESSH
jgi:hypothetical protein